MHTATRGHIIEQVTNDYISTLDKRNLPPIPQICHELVEATNDQFELENATIPKDQKGRKYAYITDLTAFQVASLVLYLHDIRTINCGGVNSDPTTDMLALYQPDGDNAGIYLTSQRDIERVIKLYNTSLSEYDIKQVLNDLQRYAPRTTRCEDPDLIAVNNGIFNYRTKTLEPFSPDKVFLTKSRINFIQNPVNPIIHNTEDNTDWDVESWMQELSDDPEIVQVLWEILGAIIRPFVHWNKSAWFYSTIGNNGKGTLCELMRNLCGENTWCTIPLANFNGQFALEPLTRSTAIIVDENDVGGFIDRAANLKAVVTGDAIPIDRKFKTPISYQFHGFMVQCINEYPRVRDKSESFYRRQLFVPFEKCFTGIERTYIKSDYLKRHDVLEYVLHKVLTMPDYYALSEPESCKNALGDYKESNDPIRQFCSEMLSEFKWDLLPFTFLYDLYQVWYKQNQTGSIQGRNGFTRDLYALIKSGEFKDWTCGIQLKTKFRPKHMMDDYEPFVIDYDLKNWQSKTYTGSNPKLKAKFQPNNLYTGIIRVSAANKSSVVNNDDDDDEEE